MEEGECLEFPSFEPFDAEDRPPPPSIDDYPLGCEVELVDIGPARLAQTPELWEPFMENLFAPGRRTVRVVRHQGDYTFVIYDADPELIIGCTLYRACLSEPKVRFKKYVPHHNAIEARGPAVMHHRTHSHSHSRSHSHTQSNIHNNINSNSEGITPGDCGLFEVYASSNEEEEPAVCGSDPLGINTKGGAQRSMAAPEMPRRYRNSEMIFEGRQDPQSPTVPQAPTTTTTTTTTTTATMITTEKSDATRRKYNYATKKAYDALNKQNYMEAVRYYTKALKYSPDGGARALSNRSVAFLGLRDTEAAFKDATRVIELIPHSFLGYVRAGNTLRGLKKFEEARTYYEKALELDPNNETLRYLLASNSVMLLYAANIEHRRVSSILLDRVTNNIILIAKKDMRVGELAWVETTTIVTLFGNSRNVNRTGSSSPRSSYVCHQCYRPLTRTQEFCDSMPGMQPSLLNKMYNDQTIVQCNDQCGILYCSESCRAKAWAAHHWVECPVRGKWAEAYRLMPGLLEDFATEINSVTNKRRKSSTNSNNNHHNTNLLRIPSLADDDIDVIIACIGLTCRMFSKIISNGRPLDAAINMYEWLLPKESSYNACINNHTTNLNQKIIIDKVLTPVYSTLRQCFSAEEQQYLSFNVFFHCYERARFNSVKVRTSAWPNIQSKAESYLELFKMRSNESSTTSLHNSLGGGGGGGDSSIRQVSSEAQFGQLERIVATPAEMMAGYFECLAIFKVFAATFAPNAHQDEGHEHFNVKMRQVIEPAAVVHVDVTEGIYKGEQIVADRSINALIV